MIHLIPPGTQFDFVGKRKLWLGISVLGILVTVVLFFTKGLNYGIDFTGGAELQVHVPWEIHELRTHLGDLKGLRVQQIGDPAAREFLVRVQGDEASLGRIGKRVEEILSGKLQPGQFEIKRVDVVGPAAGGLLRQRGFLAMFYALLAILIYVAVRFDTRYAPGAVLALFHDTVICIGIFIVTQRQFDLTVLAAILALIGYSNNDTIIVFDRVRETSLLFPQLSIEKVVNKAVNETLARTILTSLTTFFVVLALFFLGGPVIENFAFTLMVGIVVGSYSSIFIASSLVILLTHLKEKNEARARLQTKKSNPSARPEPKLQA